MPGRLAQFDDSFFKNEFNNIFSRVDDNIINLKINYNISPTTNIAVLLNTLTYTYSQFGLIPSWANDNKSININARCETLLEKNSFKESFKSQRCLIPINGWYEWKANKEPYFIMPKDKTIFVCAGLYSKRYDSRQNKVSNNGIECLSEDNSTSYIQDSLF